jgi:hypothetical protein
MNLIISVLHGIYTIIMIQAKIHILRPILLIGCLSNWMGIFHISPQFPVADIREGVQPDITFLTRQFLELYDKVGEMCDCPVCFCTLTKEETAVPFCGHLVCKACKLRLTECPTCRKSY